MAPYTPAAQPTTKAELLTLWDEATGRSTSTGSQIPPGRFQEHDVAFGVYPGQIYAHVLYFIENECTTAGRATSTFAPWASSRHPSGNATDPAPSTSQLLA
jgi:hypothetical protein